jgi:hypothetical protein
VSFANFHHLSDSLDTPFLFCDGLLITGVVNNLGQTSNNSQYMVFDKWPHKVGFLVTGVGGLSSTGYELKGISYLVDVRYKCQNENIHTLDFLLSSASPAAFSRCRA